jgi:hypothetical protein
MVPVGRELAEGEAHGMSRESWKAVTIAGAGRYMRMTPVTGAIRGLPGADGGSAGPGPAGGRPGGGAG